MEGEVIVQEPRYRPQWTLHHPLPPPDWLHTLRKLCMHVEETARTKFPCVSTVKDKVLEGWVVRVLKRLEGKPWTIFQLQRELQISIKGFIPLPRVYAALNAVQPLVPEDAVHEKQMRPMQLWVHGCLRTYSPP